MVLGGVAQPRYSVGVAAIDRSLVALLDRHGFVANESRTSWRFEGHPSQACTVDLDVDIDARDGEVVYRLSIAAFPGGEGYEDEVTYTRAERAELESRIERVCALAREPYVKTRLQRIFEPWLGHDMAAALFHRRRKRERT